VVWVPDVGAFGSLVSDAQNDEEIEYMLDGKPRTLASGKHFAVLSTLNKDGSIQSHPMWCGIDDEGHILINTGVYDSADMIRASVESLGFEFDDIEILLTTQAHWDHVADLAEIKRRTGARLFAHEDDVPVLEDGGNSDFRFPEGRGTFFEPVSVDRALQHGDTIELGGTVLTLHHHPGHTKGASSFTFDTEDGGRTYSVLVVNMGSVNNGVELLNMPGYPEIAEDYAATFAAQKALSADVWVSSHGRHYDLYDKFMPGDSYDPQRFADPEGYIAKIEEYEQLYLRQLATERAQQAR